MNKIKVSLPDYPVNGKQISFISPCSSANTECLVINDDEYSVVDADGVSVAGLSNVWNSGAMVSAILNVDTKTAYIQNANTNTYIEGQFQTQTQKLKYSDSMTREDTIPFYSQSTGTNHKVSIATLKEVLGVQSTSIVVTTCEGAEVVCTDGTTTYLGSGSTQFSSLDNGTWTITATLGEKTATAIVEVTGVMQYNVDLMILSGIAVTSAPTTTTYYVGEAVDTTGLVVTATYADGTTEDVTENCTISPTTVAANTTAITVSYSRAGLSTTTTFSITVRTLSSIKVTTAPTKTAYKYGETFSSSGMVITATYSDGATKTVTGWTYSPTDALTLNNTTITISYTENGVTETCTQAITVSNYLSNIEVTTAPTKTSYYNGDTFNTTGMVVTATYADGSTKVVTGYTYSPTTIASNTTAITISYTEDDITKTCTQAVSVTVISSTLNSNSWATIRNVSNAGKAANYWATGDTKAITINGTVGNTTFSSLSLNAFIIGFDHNSSKEGTNRIHFQIGKSGSTDVCLCDSKYNSTSTSSGYFQMNTSNSNNGGWSSSYMRTTLLGNSNTPTSPLSGSLMAALPSALRSVMKSVTKYTDNDGDTNTSDTVTATTDYLFLLAEFEVHGTHSSANQYEQDSQAQYAYYSAGNSKIKYKHDNTTSIAKWWCRSAMYGNNNFCYVNGSGNSSVYLANVSHGVAPGFCV